MAVGQNLLNRNPASTLATAAGLHPFLRLLYAHFGERTCSELRHAHLGAIREDEIVERLAALSATGRSRVSCALAARACRAATAPCWKPVRALRQQGVCAWMASPGRAAALNRGPTARPGVRAGLDPPETGLPPLPRQARAARPPGLGARRSMVPSAQAARESQRLARTAGLPACGTWFGDLQPVHFHRACPHCDGPGLRRLRRDRAAPAGGGVRWPACAFRDLLALTVDAGLARFVAAGDLPPPTATPADGDHPPPGSARTGGLGYSPSTAPRRPSHAARRSASAWRWR